MTAVPDAPTTPMHPDRWQRFLGRVLPWFDQRRWFRERRQTQRVLEVAGEAMTRSGKASIRIAYEQYADGLKRR